MSQQRRTRLAVLVGLLAGVAVVPLLALAVTGPAVVEPGTAFNSSAGPTVVVNESAAVDTSQPFPDSSTVALGVAEISGSTVTTNVTGLESSDPRTTATPGGAGGLALHRTDSPIGIADSSGNITQLEVIGGNQFGGGGTGSGDFAVNTGGGGGTVTVDGLGGRDRVAFESRTTGLTVATEPVSGGEATLSVPGGADWTLAVRALPPRIESGSPDGATVETGTNVTLSATVSHPEMSSETVTVEFIGQRAGGATVQIDTQTISANQTVTTDWTVPLISVSGWTVTATDSGGRSAREPFALNTTTTPPVVESLNQSKAIVEIRNSITLNATISHADFPTSSSETVAVEFKRYRTGDPATDPELGNATLTQNGTVSITHQVNIGPRFRWYVLAEDDDGDQVVSTVQAADVTGPGAVTPPGVSPGPGQLLDGDSWLDSLLLPFVALLGETLFATVLGGGLITAFWVYSGNVAFPAILVLLLGGVMLTVTAGPVAQAAQALVVIGLASTLLALARRYVL